MNVAAHAWDNGVVTKEATYEEEGEKTFTCSTCSRTKTESIEKLIREDDATADTDVDADVSKEIGIGVGSIVVIAIACGAVVLFKKKKVK